MAAIRPPAVAGQFYPADPVEARRQVAGMIASAGSIGNRIPKAIIAPHAGWIYSGPVAARAYARLAPARGRVRRVVILGPAHRLALRGLALSGAEAWASPLGPVLLDRDSIKTLAGLPGVGVLDEAHALEHAIEVHLPFLQVLLEEFTLLPVAVGEAPPEMVAAVIDAAWDGPETVIVVSTDLSHYLDYDSCRRIDGATAAAIERFETTAIARDHACGQVALAGLLLTARRRAMTIERMDLRTSGDTAGSRGRVVGYGAWTLYEAETP